MPKPPAPRKPAPPRPRRDPAPFRRPLVAVADVSPPLTEGVPLAVATAYQCRWIEGPTVGAHVCGHAVVEGTSWCPTHSRRIHQARAARPLADILRRAA